MKQSLQILSIALAILIGCNDATKKEAAKISSGDLAVDTFVLGLKAPVILPIPDSFPAPKVAVEVQLSKTEFKFGEDISVIITLRNNTKDIQIVYFDRPVNTFEDPAWTSVHLINKRSGEIVTEYDSRNIFISQSLDIKEVYKNAYRLKPSAYYTGRFSLANMVVLKEENQKLPKGNYEMQVDYAFNKSNFIEFTVY